jgi:hypothetical protein
MPEPTSIDPAPAPANEPASANTDPNAGQNTPPSNEPPPANTATPPAANQVTEPNGIRDLGVGCDPGEPGPPGVFTNGEKPADQNPAPDILDLAKGEEQKKQEAAEKADADFEAYVKGAGFDDGITSVVMRNGESGEPEASLPAREVGAILSVLKGAGIPAEKAGDMIGMVAALDRLRSEEQSQADEKVLAAIRADTAKEFGDSLGAAARDMFAGGQRLFGAELWNDICTISALVNDKRFVRALASYGRSARNDDGGPAPASGGARSGQVVFDLGSFGQGTR